MNLLVRCILKIQGLLNKLDNKIRSYIITPRFKRVGNDFHFSFPLTIYGAENISIGNNFTIGERCKLRTFSNWGNQFFSPQIVIADNVTIQSDCHISAIDSVIIEDNVLMASFIYISDHSHGKLDYIETQKTPIERSLYSKGPIRICKNVWIGEKASILPGVTIGEGSIIGANSVVTHDIPPFSIACGAPARIIRRLK